MRINLMIYVLILKISLMTVQAALSNNSSYYASFSHNFTTQVCLPNPKYEQNLSMETDLGALLEDVFNDYMECLDDVEVKRMQKIKGTSCFYVLYEMDFRYSDSNAHFDLITSFLRLIDEKNNKNLTDKVACALTNSTHFKNANLSLVTSLKEFKDVIRVLKTHEMCSKNPCRRYHDCSVDNLRLHCRHYCDRKDEYCKHSGKCYREVNMEDKPKCICQPKQYSPIGMHFYYGGERCDTKKLYIGDKFFILVIGLSVSFLVFFIAIFMIKYRILKNKIEKNKGSDTQSVIKFEEKIEMDYDQITQMRF